MLSRLRPASHRPASTDPFVGLGQLFQHALREASKFEQIDPPGFPPMNVWESDEVVVVESAIAGFSPDLIDVTVAGDELRIEGRAPEIADNGSARHRTERALGPFVRRLKLPVAVDEEKIAADYKNGLLTIELPKARAALPRAIEVTAASA